MKAPKTPEYLQQIVDSFTTPLQVLQPVFEGNDIIDFTYRLTNEAYALYAGTTPDKLSGRKVGEVFPGYFQTTSYTKLVEVYQSTIADTWEIHYNEDGLDLYNQMSASRLGDELIVQITDFTKLKLLQLELMERVDQLKRSNEQLDEFTHVASHDLKEPIRKIKVFAGLLKTQLEEQLQPAHLESFDKIQRAADRMRLLIDDVLNFSRASHASEKMDEVDLNTIVAGVQEDLELDIAQTKTQISVDPLPTVTGNARQLQQLFHNLVSNAIKYSKTDVPPVVFINSLPFVEGDGRKFVVLEVSDNGIGFDEQHSETIFELFSRLHSKDKYSGTGVGLAIVKKVAENHGGKVEVRSVAGEGSTFRVYLPAA